MSINNINSGSNPSFFVDNDITDFGIPTPHNTQYDGYTILLTTDSFAVTAGQTYHIKLIIADAGDSILHSIVYIKAQSLGVCPMGTVFCNGNCATCCPVSSAIRIELN